MGSGHDRSLLSKDVVRQNRLFRGLDEAEMNRALSFFDASVAEYKKGEYLHYMGRPMFRFGLVLQGQILVCTDDINGNRMIMVSVAVGDTFGESLSFLRVEDTPVYIYAASPARVLWLSPERIANVTESGFDADLKNRFIAMLAERTLSMNSRIQILSKLTLRDKLITLFSEYSRRGQKNITLPYNRSDMAVYLGTNRSALSRELSQMKQEGIIDYSHSSFRILRPTGQDEGRNE